MKKHYSTPLDLRALMSDELRAYTRHKKHFNSN